MIPKQKAEQLVEKFYLEVNDPTNNIILYKERAKRCALICINEILLTEPCRIVRDNWNEQLLDKEYWQKVKQEIEKI